ncbi:DUF4833 domain-containing protein [Flavobacterium salilacus subsp. salilacus]|uniref:DUF4833 domain-containing protein n=1 Tax=Flavobacterium TaxID=237 RepID=UPI0013C2CD0A|nr:MULTISPECIES: DUF4833 domain-containing protein [Flavobacterium]KAF2519670.1 DUF4833 domain-containing protein [Flavobacterium salilacus subsp. salilacus]MBE1614443.1 DUF4833 domain-containing protein [Flavobacterium sp. SaA2.13]
MKKVLILLLCFIAQFAKAQNGYPVPPVDSKRLFYIQHSNNHNTYVYDAGIKNGKLDDEEPVVVYRIVYTKGGIKDDLTVIQRTMAYGVELDTTAEKLCTFTLAAYPEKKLRLEIGKNGEPYVTVNVNGKNIILKKMFLFANKTGTKVEYIDFYGKDITKGKDVVERFYPS